MNHPLLTVGTILSAFAVGITPLFLDAFKPTLKERLDATDAQTERRSWLFFLAWVPAMPLTGWAIDHWAVKEILFAGLLACAAASVWLALSDNAISSLFSIFSLGVAFSIVVTSCIWNMPKAFDFHEPSSAVAAFNLGFVFVVLGAVVGMRVLPWLQKRSGLRNTLLMLSLYFVIPAALTALTPADHFSEGNEDLSFGQVFSHPFVGMLGLVLLLYFALENCLDVWPQRYLAGLGFSPEKIAWPMTFFWLAFLVARVAMGTFAKPGLDIWILLALTLFTAFTLGNLTGAQDRSSGVIGLLICGLCYGPLLPGLLGLVMPITGRGQSNPSATALGCLLCLSGLDTVLFGPLIKRYAADRPATSLVRVPIVLALLIAAPLLIIALMGTDLSPGNAGK